MTHDKLIFGLIVVIALLAGANASHGAASDLPKPQLIVNGHETVVASAVVTDERFGADTTGMLDASGAIQKAIQLVGRAGGGVVYLPKGRYRIERPLKLQTNVALVGDVVEAGITPGTWLLAYPGHGDESGTPLLTLDKECALMNLVIAYPKQRHDAIVPYPYTVQTSAAASIINVIFCNSYNGIFLKMENTCVLSHIRGTFLKNGISMMRSTELGWTDHVDISARYWMGYVKHILKRPFRDADLNRVTRYMDKNLVALRTGRIDMMTLTDFTVSNAKMPVLMEKGDHAEDKSDSYGFGGSTSGFPTEVYGPDRWYHAMHYGNLDKVPEANGESYTFVKTPAVRNLSKGAFFVVTDPDFGAIGDGVHDDTVGIQKAMSSAASAGGIVYLPQGNYKITQPLVIPPGVELRGPLARGQARLGRDCCILSIYPQAGEDEAAIVLSAHSGIRGVSLLYPEQSYDMTQLKQYPWTIRGKGAGCWVMDVLLLNAMYGIDLASAKCDGAVVRGVWASAYYDLLKVGGGSENVVLERIAGSYGPVIENRLAKHLSDEETKAVMAFFRENARFFIFEDCVGLRTWGLAGFIPSVFVVFDKGPLGTGCVDAEFWHAVFDVPVDTSIQANAGKDIAFYAPFLTRSSQRNMVEFSDAFEGPLTLYGPALHWSGYKYPIESSKKQFNIFNETNLATGKKITVSQNSSSARNLIDRDEHTFWEGEVGDTVEIDLGAPHVLTHAVIFSAWLNGADESMLNGAKILKSLDGRRFTTAATFGGPDMARAKAVIKFKQPIEARCIRMELGSNVPDVSKFRIAELRLYGDPKSGAL